MPEWILYQCETIHRSFLKHDEDTQQILWNTSDNQLHVSINNNVIQGKWEKGGIFEPIQLPSSHQFHLWAHLHQNTFRIGIKGPWGQWSTHDWKVVAFLWNRHQQYRNDALIPEQLAQFPDEDWLFIWDQCSSLFQWDYQDPTRDVQWVYSEDVKKTIHWILQNHKSYHLQFITPQKYALATSGKPILESNLLSKKIQKITPTIHTIVWISDSFSLAHGIEFPKQIQNIIFVFTKKILWKNIFQQYRRKWLTIPNTIYEKYPYLLDCNPTVWEKISKSFYDNPEPSKKKLNIFMHPWFSHHLQQQNTPGSLQHELISWGIAPELQHRYSLLCMDVHKNDWAPKWEKLECPVTLSNDEENNYIEWPCGHILEEDAHWKHLTSHKHPTCPLCRSPPAQKQVWRRIVSNKKETYELVDLFGPLTAICWRAMDRAINENYKLQIILPPAPLNGMILHQWKKWRALWGKNGIKRYKVERELCPNIVDLRFNTFIPKWTWEDIHSHIRIDTIPENGWDETLDMTFF